MDRKGSLKIFCARWILVCMMLTLAACQPAPPPLLNLVVFLEVTPYPEVNDQLLRKFLGPVYEKVIRSKRAVKLEVYAISSDTEAGTALLSRDFKAGWRSKSAASGLQEDFRALRPRFNQIYPEGHSYLVDVLGTAILLDRLLAAQEGETHVLYLSDMVQQEEFDESEMDRYDFSEQSSAKSLEDCKNDLEPKFSRFLSHRDQFSRLHVHLVYLGLDQLQQSAQPKAQDGMIVERTTAQKTVNVAAVKTFWEYFFHEFLKVQDVDSYTGSTTDALNKTGL